MKDGVGATIIDISIKFLGFGVQINAESYIIDCIDRSQITIKEVIGDLV